MSTLVKLFVVLRLKISRPAHGLDRGNSDRDEKCCEVVMYGSMPMGTRPKQADTVVEAFIRTPRELSPRLTAGGRWP